MTTLTPGPWDDFPCDLPSGQSGSTLSSLIRQAAERLEVWQAECSERPPLPNLVALPSVPPTSMGLDDAQLFRDLDGIVNGSYNPWHPGALSHLDPPPNPASVLAELVCAWLNNNMLAEELSPLLTRLERSLLGWTARRLGLGPSSGGVLASGGTLCNLTALVAARRLRGLGTDGRACVYTSTDAHCSLAKALRVMGLPASALRLVPVDDNGRMDPESLDRALATETDPVLAVVATAGTTIRGAVDPVGSIADVCALHDVWLHVDGAIGAVCGLSDRYGERVAAIGRADSLILNPQKWLGIAKASAMLLMKHPEGLAETYATPLPYVEPSRDAVHGGDCGLQGTRPAEVLKLWLGLRQLGLAGIDQLIGGALRRAQVLREALAPLQLHVPSGDLHIACFRPLDHRDSDVWSRQTRAQLLARGLMLSRPLLDGHRYLKAVMGNPFTNRRHITLLANTVAKGL